MKHLNKWFMLRILDKDEKYYVLFGLYTKTWSCGFVSWNKGKEYDWR